MTDRSFLLAFEYTSTVVLNLFKSAEQFALKFLEEHLQTEMVLKPLKKELYFTNWTQNLFL